MTEEQKIIQLCLYEGGAVKKTSLENILPLTPDNISKLRNLLAPLGLSLIESKLEIEICLAPEINQDISNQKISELGSDLSESALQTLAVVLYKPGCTKPEIDFVRGVDSVRSLRTLLLRGLIEKSSEKNRNNYFPSTETLKFLSINTVENLPDFPEISDKLSTLISG